MLVNTTGELRAWYELATVVARLIEAGATIQIRDESALESSIASLLRDPARHEALALRALEIVSSHQGATRRTAQLVLGI